MKELTGQDLEFYNYYARNDMFTVIYKYVPKQLPGTSTVPSQFVEFRLMKSEIFAVHVEDDKTKKVVKLDSLKELKKLCKGVNIALRIKEASIKEASDLIIRYSQIDGSHHKAWVLDQALRILQLDNYEKMIKDSDPNDEYDWDTGIAP